MNFKKMNLIVRMVRTKQYIPDEVELREFRGLAAAQIIT